MYIDRLAILNGGLDVFSLAITTPGPETFIQLYETMVPSGADDFVPSRIIAAVPKGRV